MIRLDYDYTIEGANADLTRLIDKYLQRGNRTLKRAFVLRGVEGKRERYEAMLQDAAQDFWAAQCLGKLADQGGIAQVEQPIGVLMGGVDAEEAQA